MATLAHSSQQMLRGIAWRALAALLFSGMAAMLKLASSRGVSTAELLFYRGAFAIPVTLGWVLAGPGLGALRTRRPQAHAWRSALGLSAMFFYFQSLALLPLADATTLYFTTPVFATILSALVLSEAVGRHRWAAVVVGFLGVLVVLRPGQAALPLLGVAAGLVSGLLAAAVAITLRQLSDSEHVAATCFWFTLAMTLVGLALLPVYGQPHDWTTLAILAAAGACGGVAQLFMTGSLGLAPVAVIIPFDYFQLFGAMLLGWLLFATEPTVNTIGGGAMIIAAGFYTVWRERRRAEAAAVSRAGEEPG